MDALVFSILLLASALLGGFLGSLTGLGGGIVLVPLMVLAFGVDLKYAVGASLVAVIATSSGAAAAFVREGYTNVRVAVFLEVATVAGALVGAALAGLLPREAIAIIFGLTALYSAWGAAKPPAPAPPDPSPDALSTRLRLDSTYPTAHGMTPYRVHRIPGAFVVMIFAGALSALVGVGAGILKVLAMDRLMRLPFKVSTTTSNFMIGVTAAASAGVYFHRGQLEPALCGPVVLGALGGSLVGARVLPRIKTGTLRKIFAVLVALAGAELIRRALMGQLTPH
ncbi:hypothetical protein PHYC_03025 [Phycisphaerales bacterium]|nr:hypothetical protein PHYC_03025 [Phycisphaerales bacterium]